MAACFEEAPDAGDEHEPGSKTGIPPSKQHSESLFIDMNEVDEGHGFARPENRIDFNARAEAFLAQNLGGRAEPIQGEKYPGSTAVVKVIGK